MGMPERILGVTTLQAGVDGHLAKEQRGLAALFASDGAELRWSG